MRRYYILEGDKTTVNGVVQKHTGAASTTSWHGRTVSNIDDKILCPACKSEGKIKPVGERHSFGNKGFIPALNDDLCICKCSPPPKLVHSQTVFYQDVASGVGDTSNTTNTHSLNAQNNLVNNLLNDTKVTDEVCACNRDITLNDLKSLAVGSTSHLEKFVEPLNQTLKLYEINTCIRKAYFIAQTFLESGEYKFLEELGISPQQEQEKYHGYKGRGLIQLTFPEPYIKYGKFKGVNFQGANRTKIATPQYAVDSAGWFWTKFKSHNLNQLSDKNDLIGVSAVINGGFNHFDADSHSGKENRKAYLLKAFEILKVKYCKTTPPVILQNLDDFQLKNSIVYDMVGETFGWGIWHDQILNKQGCSKSSQEAQNGYKRFLELAEAKKFNPSKRYGYTIEQARTLAKSKFK